VRSLDPILLNRGLRTGSRRQIPKSFAITRIDLSTEAEVPGIDEATFQKYAVDAKQNCPVSKALAGTQINLTAKLKSS